MARSRKNSILVALVLLSNALTAVTVRIAIAAETKEPSAFEKALMTESSVQTKETIVQYGDRQYRKVEYKGEIFYLQLMTETTSPTDLKLLCDRDAQAFNTSSKALVTVATRVTKRTHLFIEGLKSICRGAGNQARVDVAPSLAVGFMLDDDPNPKALLKNRKIFVDPFSLNGAGFNADF